MAYNGKWSPASLISKIFCRKKTEQVKFVAQKQSSHKEFQNVWVYIHINLYVTRQTWNLDHGSWLECRGGKRKSG